MQIEILTRDDLAALRIEIAALRQAVESLKKPEPSPYMTPAEAEAFLGYRSRTSLNNRLKAAGIQKVVVGGRGMYRRSEIEKLVNVKV